MRKFSIFCGHKCLFIYFNRNFYLFFLFGDDKELVIFKSQFNFQNRSKRKVSLKFL
jgi:hypothetical protein